MGSTGLHTIPSEVFRHLSFYLPEEDIEALSETCVYIYDALNDNTVWKRLQSKQTQSLPLISQQLDPPFIPDPDFCKNRQLILMKKHLINNWRNQNFVEHRTKTKHSYSSGVFNVPKGKGQIIYKDSYIFLGRFTNDIHSDAIEVWDIRSEPVLHSVIPMEDIEYDSFYVFEQALAVVVCSRVDVYEINIESKEFPLLYSFLITEDEVVWNKPAYHVGRHDMRCVGWNHCRVNDFLISAKCDDEPYYPVLHVWDISNACKVGAFVSPIVGFSISVLSFEEDDWFLCQNRQSGNKLYYFKFNVKSRKFSDNVFEYDGRYATHRLFYKDHLIMFKNADETDSAGWYDSVCEVYDLNNSKIVQERRFDNAHKNYILNTTVIVNGKFVLLCKGSFLVVDALSLETIDSFPCDESLVRFITNHINVYGQLFVVASEKDNRVYIWDVEKKTRMSTSLPGNYASHLYVNESRIKCVIPSYYALHVIHFW